MSLIRLIIWSSLIGGWTAFFGWLVMEIAVGRWVNEYDIIAFLMATLVAAPIGGGICCASGLTNPRLEALVKRLALGFGGGLLGGLLGVLFGFCIFSGVNASNKHLQSTMFDFAGRVVGWTLIGIGIGCGIGAGEGLFDRSLKKLRNGLIGGVLGGFLGGLFFGLIAVAMSQRAMTGRAVSFVLLGLCIGLFIGLAQVILKEAWLTVEGGFRPGRQMILGSDLITMGTSEKASLIFIAYGAKGVEPIHLKITKQADGRFLLEDNQSRTGTLVNGQPVSGPTQLKDGDAIQFGVNVVRFNERAKRSGTPETLPAAPKETPKAPVPVEAVTAKAPVPAPKPAPVAAIQAAPAPPKPVAVAAPKPEKARCPICDKEIVGLPGQRRCGKCFTTF